MQRRLALAAAFVHDPTLVFLDEPTAGIDPILRSTFWEQFREMRDDGATMCVTTQYVGEAAFCDYVGLLSDGELLMLDTPENLRRAAFDGEVVDIEMSREVEPSELAELSRIDGVISGPDHVAGRMWRLVVDDADEAIDRLDDVLRATAAADHRDARALRRLRRGVRPGDRATPVGDSTPSSPTTRAPTLEVDEAVT